jgi:hypothetical protein
MTSILTTPAFIVPVAILLAAFLSTLALKKWLEYRTAHREFPLDIMGMELDTADDTWDTNIEFAHP